MRLSVNWSFLAILIVLKASSICAASPLTFDGNLDSPLDVGGFTLSGGELLYHPISGLFAPGAQSGLYATTSEMPGYSNPLTIEFDTPPTGFVTLLVLNMDSAIAYFNGYVAMNPWGVKFVQPEMITPTTYQIAQTPALSDYNPKTEWRFGIVGVKTGDGTTLLQATPVPEASSMTLAIVGLGGAAFLNWQRGRRR